MKNTIPILTIALLANSLLSSCSQNKFSSKYPLPPTRPTIETELLLDQEKSAQANRKLVSTGTGGLTTGVLRNNGTDSAASNVIGILATLAAEKTMDHYQTKERIESINQMSERSFRDLTHTIRSNNLEFTRFALQAEESISLLEKVPIASRSTKEFKSHVKATRSFLRKQSGKLTERSGLLESIQKACARPSRVRNLRLLQTQMQKSKRSLEISISRLDATLK